MKRNKAAEREGGGDLTAVLKESAVIQKRFLPR